jgi:hypothetical protein
MDSPTVLCIDDHPQALTRATQGDFSTGISSFILVERT